MKKLALLMLVLLLPSCELLNAAGTATVPADYTEPVVALEQTALMSHPTIPQAAAFYCPRYFDASWCAAFLGPPPPREVMAFRFDLHFAIDNPNEIPVPTTEILTSLRVFEGLGAEELGAICVVLCNEGDPKCTGAPGPGDCVASESDVDSIEDFAQAAVNFLVLVVEAAATGDFSNLQVRMLPAGGAKIPVVVKFALDIDTMIDLVATFAEQIVSDYQSGKDPRLDIPFAVRGTLWFELPIIGRVSVRYGPFESAWAVTD